ncbi:MAG: site-specific integrase [Rickettsiales bacterium]|nr:site-specific integrase [Rickettsiales bacterium]
MKKSEKIHFTEKVITGLPTPTKEEGSKTYYDSGSTDGLMLIVTYGGTKTYYFYMLFQGRPTRVKLGRVGDIKLLDARAKAHTMREQATMGEDPSKKRKADLKDITFKEFYETVYKPEYSSIHNRPRTVVNNDSIFTHRLKDFHNRKLLSIKPDELEKLHNKTMKELSPYTANRVLSLVKHIFVIAIKHGYIPTKESPAEHIKKFPELSRDRFLQSDEIPRLLKALETETNEVFKNYVLLSLFTGLRRSNVLTMRWSNVDLNNGFIYSPDSKNGQPIQTPMVKQTKDLLKHIKSTADSDWVLPSNKSGSGHLEDPKRPWQDLLKRAGIENLRLHDLRRTQGSYQAITGASLNLIGASLSHKSNSATQVYARLTIDPVRDAMQKSVDKMLEFTE